MTPLLLHAFLLVTAAMAAAAENATTGPVPCNGAGCGPPLPLPIYGGPPPSPPSTPASPGTQAPCPPVPAVCCGGQNTPQQPYYQPPPAAGYVPYYNSSASRSVLRPAAVCYYVTAVSLVWWAVV